MIIQKKQVRMLIVFISVLTVLYFLWLVRSALYPFIIGLFLAYLLNPSVCYLERKGASRLWAIIIVYVILFSSVIIGGSQFIPLLIRELENFAKEMPAITKKVEELFQLIQWQYQNSLLPFSLRIALDNALLSLQNGVQEFTITVVSGILSLASHIIGLVISPILAFYLLHDWYRIKEGLLFLLPTKFRREAVAIFKDIDKVLSGVIRGQLTIALIVGVLVSAGLYFLHVNYFLLIAILAGILDVIPYFGAFIGATPAVTLALLHSPLLAFKVAILFFLIHQLEGMIIQPRIMGENVGLHPLSVIFFVFVGGELAGFAGMLLGVPVAAIGKVIIKHLYNILV